MLKNILIIFLVSALVGVAAVIAGGLGWFGAHEGPGMVTGSAIPADVVRARTTAQRSAAAAQGVGEPKQVLFGDLHVPTTVYVRRVHAQPAVREDPPPGEGPNPPADACDFARFCSALDFWSINDHAESLTPTQWRATVEAVRECNAAAGDPAEPRPRQLPRLGVDPDRIAVARGPLRAQERGAPRHRRGPHPGPARSPPRRARDDGPACFRGPIAGRGSTLRAGADSRELSDFNALLPETAAARTGVPRRRSGARAAAGLRGDCADDPDHAVRASSTTGGCRGGRDPPRHLSWGIYTPPGTRISGKSSWPSTTIRAGRR